MEEAPENGKESSHSAHASGMNLWLDMGYIYIIIFFSNLLKNSGLLFHEALEEKMWSTLFLD